MTTGLTYQTYQNEIATLAALGGLNSPGATTISVNDPNFVSILPFMIDYAELRIIQDLDLLSTVTTGTALASTTTRQLTIPGFVTVQQLNVITPASTVTPDLGTRNPLLATSKEFLDAVYPDATSAALPVYMAPLLQTVGGTTGSTQSINTFLLGPFPDAAYTVEIVGTYRPPSLSATVTSTFISQSLPHLFTFASMVFISAYQRNFGRLSDDPQMAITYESQYQTMKQSATVEEFRKKFQSSGWASLSPAVVASPTRG
jgi:hypothetical protein